jgi:uncharacterized protein (TIGR01440 family)
MTYAMIDLSKQVIRLTEEFVHHFPLSENQVLVMGVSTSEVAGQRIGTSGSEAIAAALWEGALDVQSRHGYHLAFQCCEHLNRALVVERRTLEAFALTPVTAVPVPQAGGAMAAYAFRHFNEARLVEAIQADAGIDIGDTLIGMHLKPVAVPVRPSHRQVGHAHVTMAKTRPKLIGGARAVYVLEK